MSEEQNGGGLSRLDRIERALEMFIADHEQFRDEHKLLLTAQVLQSERMDQLTKTMQELAEAQKHTDERMNALILAVDGLIRGSR